MPRKKSRSVTIPPALNGDIDFGYVRKLSASECRLAAYYEYARESDEIKAAVKELREKGAFIAGPKTPVSRELQDKLFYHSDCFPIEVLFVLTRSTDFPERSFAIAIANVENAKTLAHWDPYYAMRRPICMPWKTLLSLRNDHVNAGGDELEFFEKSSVRHSSVHALKISWEYTDRELATLFLSVLPQLRPRESPEPTKAGRKGRSAGRRVTDMFNQLAAWRLNEAGLDFDEAQCRTPYTTRKGWLKAVKTADERIRNMTKRPFFGPAR